METWKYFAYALLVMILFGMLVGFGTIWVPDLFTNTVQAKIWSTFAVLLAGTFGMSCVFYYLK